MGRGAGVVCAEAQYLTAAKIKTVQYTIAIQRCGTPQQYIAFSLQNFTSDKFIQIFVHLKKFM